MEEWRSGGVEGWRGGGKSSFGFSRRIEKRMRGGMKDEGGFRWPMVSSSFVAGFPGAGMDVQEIRCRPAARVAWVGCQRRGLADPLNPIQHKTHPAMEVFGMFGLTFAILAFGMASSLQGEVKRLRKEVDELKRKLPPG